MKSVDVSRQMRLSTSDVAMAQSLRAGLKNQDGLIKDVGTNMTRRDFHHPLVDFVMDSARERRRAAR